MKGFLMVMIHLFIFYNASLLGVLVYFYFSMGGRLYDTGWEEEKKGFIYVLLLGQLIHVHGVTSDILTFNSLIIEKE